MLPTSRRSSERQNLIDGDKENTRPDDTSSYFPTSSSTSSCGYLELRSPCWSNPFRDDNNNNCNNNTYLSSISDSSQSLSPQSSGYESSWMKPPQPPRHEYSIFKDQSSSFDSMLSPLKSYKSIDESSNFTKSSQSSSSYSPLSSFNSADPKLPSAFYSNFNFDGLLSPFCSRFHLIPSLIPLFLLHRFIIIVASREPSFSWRTQTWLRDEWKDDRHQRSTNHVHSSNKFHADAESQVWLCVRATGASEANSSTTCLSTLAFEPGVVEEQEKPEETLQAQQEVFGRCKTTIDARQPENFNISSYFSQHCVFCKNNGADEKIYRNHTVKDSMGRVLCPTLRLYRCPICGEDGDKSHTVKYCPKKPIITLEDIQRMDNKV